MERITWDQFHTRVFCGVCKEECEAVNRPTRFLSNAGFKNVIEKFFARTGKQATKKQLKNKLDSIKKEFGNWMELKNSVTGLGWNDRTWTIDASDDWWKEHLKKYPSHKKWRAGGSPHLSEMECMFDKAYVTGQFTTAVGALNLDSEGDVQTEQDDEDLTPAAEGEGECGPSSAAPQNLPKRRTKIASTKRKGTSSLHDESSPIFHVYKETMDNLTGSGEASSVAAPSQSTVPTIAQAIEMVECGVEEDMYLFHTASKVMLKPEIQELFAIMKTERGRLLWL